MTNNFNVVSTPSRDSCSAYLIGLGTVPQAKELLLRELEGYVEPFNSSYLKGLLDKAASPEACDKYLSLPRGNSVYGKDGWTDLPTKPDAEDELYTPLVKIVNSILRRFNLHASRRAHDTHDKDMHSEHIEGLKARPDIIITGSGQHFRGELKQCDRWTDVLRRLKSRKSCTRRTQSAGKEEKTRKKQWSNVKKRDWRSLHTMHGMLSYSVFRPLCSSRCNLVKPSRHNPRANLSTTFSSPSDEFDFTVSIGLESSTPTG